MHLLAAPLIVYGLMSLLLDGHDPEDTAALVVFIHDPAAHLVRAQVPAAPA